MSDLDQLTVDELRDLAGERGVSIPAESRKADIIALLEAEVPAEVIEERTAVRVRVDADGFAVVRGERVNVGTALAGAEVTFQ